MIYTAPYVMLLMRAKPLRRQVGGGWALEIETFLGPVKWHRVVRRVPFGAQQNCKIYQRMYTVKRAYFFKKCPSRDTVPLYSIHFLFPMFALFLFSFED
jgi:hypothetical protein